MNTQNNMSRNLWCCRGSLPRISPGMNIVLFLIVSGASGLSVLSPGTVWISMIISASAAAFSAVCRRNILFIFTLPAAYGIAFLCCHDALTAALSLLFVPLAAALIYSVFTERNLAVTTAICSFAVTASFAAAVIIYLAVNGNFSEGISDFFNSFRNAMTEALESIGLPDKNGELMPVFSDTQISAAVETTIMISPSVVVMICELIAYLAAKLFRLASLVTSSEYMFRRGKWQMTASAPAGAIFIIGYFITSFAGETSVVAYSAANLMYILLVPLAIAGGREMFGVGSRFRTSMSTPGRIAIIAMCAISFYLSPVLLPELFAFWAAVDAVVNAIRTFRANRRDGESN